MGLAQAGEKGFRLLLQQPEYLDVPPYRGIDVVSRILDNAESGKTLVYFDPDTDGLIAGYFICLVLAKRGIQYSTYINSNRAHGFLLKGGDVAGWTVFNGDFLVTRDIVEDIVSHGASLASLDHHECEEELIHVLSKETGAEGIVINNQYPFEDKRNHFQSGAGVTFETLRVIEPWLDTPENRALVGVTLLTDIRDIEQPGAWAWLWDTYTHPYKGKVYDLISQTKAAKDYVFGKPKMDRSFVDYKLSPMINSMLRFNQEEAALEFILGEDYPDVDYQKSQKALVAEMLEKATVTDHGHLVEVEVSVRDHRVDQHSIISNFVGLLASQFTGNGKSAICYVRDFSGKVMRASFRGNLSIAPYREVMLPYINGIGHGMAFGIIGLEPSPELFKKLDECCVEAEGESQVSDRYVEVKNLLTFINSEASVIAEKNCYKMGPNRILIKYVGRGAILEFEHKKFQKWKINGIEVKAFNAEMTPENSYILCMVERNQPQFYLEKMIDPVYARRVDIDEVSKPYLP